MQTHVSVTPLRQDADDNRLPVSERIRQRLVDAGHRYHVMRGAFSSDASLRREFLASLGRGGA